MEKVNVVDVVENFVKFGSEAAAGRVLKKKGVLRNFAKFPEKQLCQSLFFNEVFFIKKEAVVFSCEFCEISKNNFSTEYL